MIPQERARTWARIASILVSAFLLAGCTGVAVSKKDMAAMEPIVIVVPETPPLIWNTWSRSFKEVYPLSPLAQAIYNNTPQPPGLMPPEIPDIGELLKKRVQKGFADKLPWWPRMAIDAGTHTSTPINSNVMRVSVEKYRIAGGGNLVVFVRFTLHDRAGREVWWRVSQYHGIFDGVGDTLEERLLKGVGIEEEFEHAADVVVRDVVAQLLASD